MLFLLVTDPPENGAILTITFNVYQCNAEPSAGHVVSCLRGLKNVFLGPPALSGSVKGYRA